VLATFRLARALLNLSDILTATDAAGAAEAARAAAGHLRRLGARDFLAAAVENLAVALLQLGDWDAAEQELAHAADADGLAGNEHVACYRGWLAALRGNTGAAEAVLAELQDLRASDSPYDKALMSLVEAFTADARRLPRDTLRHARAALAHAATVGISSEGVRWAWPLATRAALHLHDTTSTGELLAMLDSAQPGHLAPMLRAERDLARARLAARNGDPSAAGLLTAAISRLRDHSTPYHLAHGLLDHAQYHTHLGEDGAAAATAGEARDIAQRLHCQPLLDRAETIQPTRPRTAAS
jgi:hypothetical protein